MKFVLIDPAGIVHGINTGLGYIASALENKGHGVVVLDFNNKNGNMTERLAVTKGADAVGISIKSFTLYSAIEMAIEAKRINPHAVLIAGGPHITIDGANFMREHSEFDYAVVGEGEATIVELADVIGGKKKIENTRGVIYRKNGAIKQNKNRAWNNRIDSIFFPDYDIFDSVIDNGGIDAYPIVTSRGCPYNCSYCSVGSVIGKAWRARAPENVIDELELAKKKYKSKEFKVLDDNFTLGVGRAKQICRMLIERNVGMGWSCPNGIRADKLDNELLMIMKDSGCHTISVGVESGDMDVFERIDKGETLEDVENAVKLIKEHGMRVEGFFIIGLPGSSLEKDKKSVAFAKKLKLDSASFGILVPYPGTRIWDWAKNDPSVRMLGDWKEGFHIGKARAIFETEDYKAKDMTRLYYIANLKTMKLQNIPKAVRILIKSLFK